MATHIILLAALLATTVPAKASSMNWSLTGLVTCRNADSETTNLESPTCGQRILSWGVTVPDFPADGGQVYENDGDTSTNIFLTTMGMSGSIGGVQADRLYFTLRFASAVNYTSSFSVPTTADVRYQGQEFSIVGTDLTGTARLVHMPEPSTLLLAGIALVFLRLGSGRRKRA